MRPITAATPKALCPVGNRPLLDHALQRVRRITDRVAVNVRSHSEQMLAHLDGQSVHVSLEAERLLGTAGAIGALRGWLDTAACLATNADAYCHDDLDRLVTGWDGDSVRLLVSYQPEQADFMGSWRFAGTSLLPPRVYANLEPQPSSLYEECWLPEYHHGRVELIPTANSFVDCGTPRDLLAANLIESGGRSVVCPESVVLGKTLRSLVLRDAHVGADEVLVDAIALPDGARLFPFENSKRVK